MREVLLTGLEKDVHYEKLVTGFDYHADGVSVLGDQRRMDTKSG